MIPLSESNRRISLRYSRLIFVVFLVVSVYTFFNKESIVAKLLATGGFIGFMYLLIISFKSSFKPKIR